MSTTINDILEQIVEEVEKMSEAEQQNLLIKLRAKKMRRNYTPIAAYGRGVKPLNMKEIDRIKHESRRK